MKHINILYNKSAHSMEKYNLEILHETQEAPHPFRSSMIPSPSGAFKKLISLLLFLPHILKLVSDGSHNFTAQSPGSPFYHTQALVRRESFPLLSLWCLSKRQTPHSTLPASIPSAPALSWKLYRVPLRYRASSPHSSMSLPSWSTSPKLGKAQGKDANTYFEHHLQYDR